MSLNLKSSGGGSVTVDVPSTASNYTATLPAGTGNVVVNGINSALVSGTSQSATGGTVTFSGIPSWAKRITVMFNGASLSGTANPLIRVATAGGGVTTGYSCDAGNIASGPTASFFNYTSGFGVPSSNAANTIYASYTLVNPSGNVWICSGTAFHNTSNISYTAGAVDAGGTLTSILLTNNGGDTWDAGSFNVYWE